MKQISARQTQIVLSFSFYYSSNIKREERAGDGGAIPASRSLQCPLKSGLLVSESSHFPSEAGRVLLAHQKTATDKPLFTKPVVTHSSLSSSVICMNCCVSMGPESNS